jgi:hypothetical protein
MAADRSDSVPLEEPRARLELALIDEFLTALGYERNTLRFRTDPAARDLLKQATIYAASKLAEVESRARYLHDIHGARAS